MIVTYIVENAKPEIRKLVETQFMGKIAYNTECKKCHLKSVKESEFFELELNVKVCPPFLNQFSGMSKLTNYRDLKQSRIL